MTASSALRSRRQAPVPGTDAGSQRCDPQKLAPTQLSGATRGDPGRLDTQRRKYRE